MPVLQDNKSPIEKIVHEPKDNYMLKLYFFVSESEIHVLFNKVQPEVFKDCDFYPVELTPSRPYYTMLTISVCNNMQKAANCMFDMSHTTTCLVMLRKVEDSSTFLCHLQTNILQHCRLPKWGDFIKAQGALVW